MTRRGSPDFWSGLVLAALGGFIVFRASGWEYLTPEGPGPGFFPLWYGIAMLALSLYLVVSPTDARLDPRGCGRALGTWAAIVVCIASLKWVSFVVSFAALVFFMVTLLYRRRTATAALVAIGMAAAFYVLFPLALGVPLP